MTDENDNEPLENARTIFEQPGHLLVGTLLDNRFLIEKDLAEGGADKGGMGLVYLAQDMKLMGKKAVVKILRKEALENEDIERKFLHEKEALIRLDHPNIVRILDTGTLTDGNLFMVMEYIPGYSLRKLLIEQNQLPLDLAADLIRQITDALAAAHSEKILHRDIKPENIMLTPQEAGPDRVRLIDFGVAKVEESKLAPQTQVSTGMGTPMYMAPEQLYGDLSPTSAIDIYSSAIVFYEILTGEKPFNPRSLIEMFELQKAGLKTRPRELRPSIPERADELIAGALSFAADDRPSDIRQFGAELANALAFPETAGASQQVAVTAPSPGAPAAVTGGGGTVTARNPIASDTGAEKVPAAGAETRGLLYVVGTFAVALVAVVVVFAGVIYWSGKDDGPEEAAGVPDTASSGPAVTAGAPSISSTNDSPPVPEGPSREFAFHLMVQKMRGGQPFEEPFRSSGREVFETGYKFRMIFEGIPAGHFYLFNEGKDAEGKDVFNILFPTPLRNEGSAKLGERSTVETGENTFAETRGTEYVWVIWTAEERSEVEAAKNNAFENSGKVESEYARAALSDFIRGNSASKTEARKDTDSQSTFISGLGDVVVYKIELEHR